MLGKFYKYHGAGNDFLLADNRDGSFALSKEQVVRLCDRHIGFGADGLMLLENGGAAAFRMVFYNPDGSGGMMCGNGGRCIVAFAADLGLVEPGKMIVFEAPDGLHQAEILPPIAPVAEPAVAPPIPLGQPARTVRLKMKDVSGLRCWPEEHSCFLDTGTRHLVKFVRNLAAYPVASEGRTLRQDPRFLPLGANVNFVEPESEGGKIVLNIRTFEKGVEDETLACGTGIVASALAAYSQGIIGRPDQSGRLSCVLKAAIARLSVDFVPEGGIDSFRVRDIWLTGPADFIGTVEIML